MKTFIRHQASRAGLAIDSGFEALERNMAAAQFAVDAALTVILFGGIGWIVCLMSAPWPVMQ